MSSAISGIMAGMGGPIGLAGLGTGIASKILGGLNDKPSKAQLALNGQVNQFSSYLTSQAQREGLDASTVFNNLMAPLQRIVLGGPSQAGWSANEFNAANTAAINRGAAAARNLGSAAATGVSAVGGGDTPGASAAERNAVLQQQAGAENQTTEDLAKNQIASDEAGRENFFKAAEQEEKLPNVFSASNEAGDVATKGNELALKSQAAVDAEQKASSGLGIASSALGGASGGLTKMGAANVANQTPRGAMTIPNFNKDMALADQTRPQVSAPEDMTQNDLIPSV
jgi:hypothetical protein